VGLFRFGSRAFVLGSRGHNRWNYRVGFTRCETVLAWSAFLGSCLRPFWYSCAGRKGEGDNQGVTSHAADRSWPSGRADRRRGSLHPGPFLAQSSLLDTSNHAQNALGAVPTKLPILRQTIGTAASRRWEARCVAASAEFGQVKKNACCVFCRVSINISPHLLTRQRDHLLSSSHELCDKTYWRSRAQKMSAAEYELSERMSNGAVMQPSHKGEQGCCHVNTCWPWFY